MRLAGPSDNFQPPGDRLGKKNLKIFHRKIWRLKKKSLPLQPQSRNDSDKSSLRDLHNSTSSTSIGEEILRINTVKRSMTLDYDKRIPERGYVKTIYTTKSLILAQDER